MKVQTIGIIGAVVVAIILGSALIFLPGSLFTHSPSTASKTPCVQKAYWNGSEYCFYVVKAIPNASQANLATAQTMYVLTYPQFNKVCSGNLSACKPQSLQSGYAPQCDPCIQESHFPYHDHILAGSLKLDTNESLVVIVLAFNPAFSNQPKFTPLNDSKALAGAEQAGDFMPINQGGSNHYEMNTGMVLVIQVQPLN